MIRRVLNTFDRGLFIAAVLVGLAAIVWRYHREIAGALAYLAEVGPWAI